jgi:hypothetical protein
MLDFGRCVTETSASRCRVVELSRCPGVLVLEEMRPLTTNSGHTTLLGAGTAKAWDEVQSGRKKLGNKRKRPQQQQH